MSWWILRRGFRPLEDIATTAGEIAQGDLGRRIDQSDSRTEVGRLGLALNAMLGDIEAAMTERARAEARLRRFLADASHELRTPTDLNPGLRRNVRPRGLRSAGRPRHLHAPHSPRSGQDERARR